jgi:polyisoprenoid-binding protein YceI
LKSALTTDKKGVFMKSVFRGVRVFALVVGILNPNLAMATTFKSKPTEGQVVFEAVGKPSFLKIKGEGEGPEGEVTVDKVVKGTFKFKIDSLKTGISMRDKHMKEKYLQVEKHPTAELTLEEVSKFDPAGAETQSSPFKGKLTIHGVTKPVDGQVEIKKLAQGYSIKASFDTKITDYGIDVPSYAGITVTDLVKVSVDSKLN